jgi:uncharacterized membrane-anchored protein
MRKSLFIVSTLLVFGVLNYSIFQKEQIKAHGETVFLELAPVDPRSLMQGDYMRLRYAVERTHISKSIEKRGSMVIAMDQNRVGTFKRIDQGETLTENEKRLPYQMHFQQLRIAPDSFMFQEGHARFYDQAKYGVFKFDSSGSRLLVGLADKDRQLIQPN